MRNGKSTLIFNQQNKNKISLNNRKKKSTLPVVFNNNNNNNNHNNNSIRISKRV